MDKLPTQSDSNKHQDGDLITVPEVNVIDKREPDSEDINELSKSVINNTEITRADELPIVVLEPLDDDVQAEQSNDSKGTRLVRGVGRSLANSVYDNTVRHLNSDKYHLVFIEAIGKDIDYFNYVNEYANKTIWIDEARLPFREIVSEINGISYEQIESKFRLLLSALASMTCFMFFSLYLVIDDLVRTIFYSGSLFNLLFSFSYLLFSILGFSVYSYHCWVLRENRFGTPKHWAQDVRKGKISAIFPYVEGLDKENVEDDI